MRLAFDAAPITHGAGGTRTYAVHLLAELARLRPDWEFHLYLRAGSRSGLEDLLRFPNICTRSGGAGLSPWRIHVELSRRLRQDQPDLFHSLGYFLPIAWRGRKVVTIHDLNVYKHARNWMRWPTVVDWAELATTIPLAVRAADHVITDSKASKTQIQSLFRLPDARLSVIHLAADDYFYEPATEAELADVLRMTGGRSYVLFAGVISPQKDLELLLRAFAQSGVDQTGCLLLLAGSDTSGYATHLRRRARQLGVDASLVMPGYVSRSTLRALYQAAECLVMPSHAEGFGLPAVEAMAGTTPVVAVRRSALPEVVGTGGLLFEPDRVGDLAGHIRTLVTDPVAQREARAYSRHRRDQFSWTRTAEMTIRVYEAVADA